jgi:hypothetical protein
MAGETKNVTVEHTPGSGIGFKHVPNPRATDAYVSILNTKEHGAVTVSTGRCFGLAELQVITDCESFEVGAYKCFAPGCDRPCVTIIRTVVRDEGKISRLVANAWPSCNFQKHNSAIRSIGSSQLGIKMPSEAEVVTRCHYCLKELPGDGIKRCSRCKAANYCSKACQAAAWPNHKFICVPPG